MSERVSLTRKIKSTRAMLMRETSEYGGDNDRHAITTYTLEPARMLLDLSDSEIGMRHNGPLSRGLGAATLFQLTVRGRDSHGRFKRVHVWVSARISGDSRAGSQDGIHVSVCVGNRGKDVAKEIHVNPARGYDENDA